MIKILFVDDHPSVLEGTKSLIEKEQDMSVTVEVSPYKALDLVRTNTYDVMLFDLYMPHMSGIDLTKKVLEICPDARILIYSGFEILPHINSLIEAGISGIISKTSTKEQLITHIRCAIRMEVILPISIFKELRRVNVYVEGYYTKHNNIEESITVSKKEEEILIQLANGRSNKEIAKLLLISQRSLEYNLTAIFQKLRVKSRIEAVEKAKKLGLLPKNL